MDEKNQGTVINNIINIIVILVIAGVVIGFIMYAIGMFEEKTGDFTQTITEVDESRYTRYEGKSNIPGTTVQSLLSQWKGDEICVTVKTKTNTTSYNYTSKDLTTPIASNENQNNIVKATVKTEKNYVNPNAKFSCTITRDENMTMQEIIFEQVK